MFEKKKLLMLALMMAMMAAMVVFAAGCAGGSGVVEKNPIETESGWTIKEDGSYTYACVIKNNSDQKIITESSLTVEGLDADGNVMGKLNGLGGAAIAIGPIWPGEKSAVVFGLRESKDPMLQEWETTPADFNFKAKVGQLMDSQGEGASTKPNLHIASADQEFSQDGYMEYKVHFENRGEEDLNVDFTGASGYILNITAVFRKEDGSITGGCQGILQNDGDIMSFPAGEETVCDVYFESVPEGEPELILTWN